MRADAVNREPSLIRHDIYKWQLNRSSSKEYVLHDGPPYANGSPHIGHALNKILKDITVRYKILRGYRVNYIPGWDCHGLPIELKALERLKGNQKEINPQQIRKIAKEYAYTQIDIQKKEFMKWGVIGDWENPYLTLNPTYEAMQIDVFLKMYQKGLIYRAYKPVYWSPSSKTALAEAELDYNENHVSPSVYVLFKVNDISSERLKSIDNLYACIWTTTPWTLSANNAICISSNITYSVVSYNGKNFLIAKDLIPSLESKLVVKLKILVDDIPGSELVGSTYTHPFIDRKSRILDGSHVTVESGTGLVHTAPGHGLEDFNVCMDNNIDVICHVNDEGRFTNEAGERLSGKYVLDEGNKEVIEILKENDCLLFHERYVHKYPYDWRTKKPVILRATLQWFADLEGIKNPSVESLENVQIIPSNGKIRLSNMIQNRDHWCISRQRSWGVPIPVFYDVDSGEPLVTEETVTHVKELIEKHGTDCWWDMSELELLHPKYRNNGKIYRKGQDTMDVWFDSGTSWAGTLITRNVKFPADLYLEGSDQHRGWFQSSLLTSIAYNGHPPFKTVLTHGFVLDGNMQKMSKSLGNVIEPSFIIEGGKNKKENPAYGADVLRLWVASTDYTKDVSISLPLIETTSNNMKKIRNTIRFLLGNLYDFKEGKDEVEYDQLLQIDKYILHKLTELIDNITNSYDQFLYYKVQHNLLNFCIIDLSSFYMNCTKDRLYSELSTDPRRRAVQTVFASLVNSLTILLAPIACHVSEDVYQNMSHKQVKNEIKSIFGEKWPEYSPQWKNENINNSWNDILNVRNQVNYLIELQKSKPLEEGGIKNPLEIEVNLYASPDHSIRSLSIYELEELFIVSKVHIYDYSESPVKNENSNYYVEVRKSEKNKCNRCWKYNCEVEEEICKRCNDVMKRQRS